MPLHDTELSVHIAGRQLPIRQRCHHRARHLVLRICPDSQDLLVTTPPGVGSAQVLAMVRQKTTWIARQLARQPDPLILADGVTLPLRGEPHVVRHCPQGRSGVRLVGREIRVCGHPEHLARRLTDWLRAHARDDLVARARRAAHQLGVSIGRVTVRDTRSRWGSCSAAGNLSFCWRLILAPDWVRDYVVAHEVSHRLEMNHSPQFWATVARLSPDASAARTWLRRHGSQLRFASA